MLDYLWPSETAFLLNPFLKLFCPVDWEFKEWINTVYSQSVYQANNSCLLFFLKWFCDQCSQMFEANVVSWAHGPLKRSVRIIEQFSKLKSLIAHWGLVWDPTYKPSCFYVRGLYKRWDRVPSKTFWGAEEREGLCCAAASFFSFLSLLVVSLKWRETKKQ